MGAVEALQKEIKTQPLFKYVEYEVWFPVQSQSLLTFSLRCKLERNSLDKFRISCIPLTLLLLLSNLNMLVNIFIIQQSFNGTAICFLQSMLVHHFPLFCFARAAVLYVFSMPRYRNRSQKMEIFRNSENVFDF